MSNSVVPKNNLRSSSTTSCIAEDKEETVLSDTFHIAFNQQSEENSGQGMMQIAVTKVVYCVHEN